MTCLSVMRLLWEVMVADHPLKLEVCINTKPRSESSISAVESDPPLVLCFTVTMFLVDNHQWQTSRSLQVSLVNWCLESVTASLFHLEAIKNGICLYECSQCRHHLFFCPSPKSVVDMKPYAEVQGFVGWCLFTRISLQVVQISVKRQQLDYDLTCM